MRKFEVVIVQVMVLMVFVAVGLAEVNLRTEWGPNATLLIVAVPGALLARHFAAKLPDTGPSRLP